MPELPDVEVFTRNLDKMLAGKKLVKVKVIDGKKLPDTAEAYGKALNGKTVSKVYRSGKEMRFLFTDDTLLGLHLMLTGDVIPFEEKNTRGATIVELYFGDGQGLALTDRMKNAHIKLDPVDKAGIDALSKKLDFAYLKKAFQRKKNIKSILIDQDIIRGIGNGYSDEILWTARVSPYSVAAAIPDAQIKKILAAIKSIFTAEIKNIAKHQKGKVYGEVKDFLKIHTKKNPKSPTGAPIIIDQKGMMKTYYTKEQILYK
jgi:formamidopyrimidine-DNA glycosylase